MTDWSSQSVCHRVFPDKGKMSGLCIILRHGPSSFSGLYSALLFHPFVPSNLSCLICLMAQLSFTIFFILLHYHLILIGKFT